MPENAHRVTLGLPFLDNLVNLCKGELYMMSTKFEAHVLDNWTKLHLTFNILTFSTVIQPVCDICEHLMWFQVIIVCIFFFLTRNYLAATCYPFCLCC